MVNFLIEVFLCGTPRRVRGMTSIVDQNPLVGAFMFLLTLPRSCSSSPSIIHVPSYPPSLLRVPAPQSASKFGISQVSGWTMAGSKAPLTLLKDLRVSSHQIPSFDRIPNTSIQKKPLLIYHSAFLAGTSASTMESHLKAVNMVEPQWRYTMYRSDIALSFGQQGNDDG